MKPITLNSHRRLRSRPEISFTFTPTGDELSRTFSGNEYAYIPTYVNTPITFTAAVRPAASAVIEYHWNFGDGIVGYGPVVTHEYIAWPGQTQVILTARLIDGNRLHTHRVINISPILIANFNPAS